MKEYKKVQYVKFIFDNKNERKLWFKKGYYEVTENRYGNLNGIIITGHNILNTGFGDRQIKGLKKQLCNYDMSEAVIIADEYMSRVLDIKDMLFQARKYEFMHNLTFITDRLKSRMSENESMVIVLDSVRWDTGDLFKILTVVKNHYRKIDVITGSDVYNLSRLSEVVYEEWGVILHIYTYNSYHGNDCDMALLFLKNADRLDTLWKRRLGYKAAYVVEDNRRFNSNNRHKCAFSGLVYKVDGLIPYEIGVNMAYQKPVVYEKFHVSVIDICEM